MSLHINLEVDQLMQNNRENELDQNFRFQLCASLQAIGFEKL